MSANLLLYWMSARRQGSWQQFRAAVEELHLDEDGHGESNEDGPGASALPLYQVLKFNLQRAGHAEFFAGAGDADWRATAPCLAITQRASGWLGILVGARSPTLLDRFHRAVGPANVEKLAFPAYPDQILVTAPNQGDVAAVAERAGIAVQRDAPAALLACLPPVDDACVRQSAQLPVGAGWKIERFSAEDLGWRSGTFDDATSSSGGLFRFSLRHQRHMLYCVRGAAFRVPGQVGKYLVLRIRRHRRRVLRYDHHKRVLVVPAVCRPPFLIERALVLCSGFPPSYEDGVLQYPDIPENIAVIAATLLRQVLQ